MNLTHPSRWKSDLFIGGSHEIGLQKYHYNAEQAEDLPAEKQKLFAEYCYIMLEKEFVTFNEQSLT